MFGWRAKVEAAEERYKRSILMKKLADLKELEDLRDRFAEKVIQGFSGIGLGNVALRESSEDIAKAAYAIADAMIEARKSKAGCDG
ncbi:hypothetical protein SAMN04488056_12316 [Cohaesibacter marisflavi]|uniref:Uncharacterized protein n=1 Tax=Cohaesibacter marisflavi TaxID=655353 RepID=A0A1I5MU27_9HYPH|nr:hypothetical protein [Cohaesibacter marisflavi]SFP12526.1 hypothetical protein SAMN04488056_12316 [Cohaesibacter marisflavi]